MIPIGIGLIAIGTIVLAIDHLRGKENEKSSEHGTGGDGSNSGGKPSASDQSVHREGVENAGMVSSNVDGGARHSSRNNRSGQHDATARHRPAVTVIEEETENDVHNAEHSSAGWRNDGNDVRGKPTRSAKPSGASGGEGNSGSNGVKPKAEKEKG